MDYSKLIGKRVLLNTSGDTESKPMCATPVKIKEVSPNREYINYTEEDVDTGGEVILGDDFWVHKDKLDKMFLEVLDK